MTNEQAARILRIDTQPQERLKYTYKTWVEVFDEACKMGAEALRGPQPDPDTGLKGCWHCINIEAHHIEYVIAVKAKGGTPMNTPVDCPYHYCPACGRKLEEKK